MSTLEGSVVTIIFLCKTVVCWTIWPSKHQTYYKPASFKVRNKSSINSERQTKGSVMIITVLGFQALRVICSGPHFQ